VRIELRLAGRQALRRAGIGHLFDLMMIANKLADLSQLILQRLRLEMPNPEPAIRRIRLANPRMTEAQVRSHVYRCSANEDGVITAGGLHVAFRGSRWARPRIPARFTLDDLLSAFNSYVTHMTHRSRAARDDLFTSCAKTTQGHQSLKHYTNTQHPQSSHLLAFEQLT
jgi:hypothetical protein